MNTGLKGKHQSNVLLASYTTWDVGGLADRIYKPFNLSDLGLFLSGLPKTEPLFWLGLGSNVLICDSGVRGTVVMTHNALKQAQKTDPSCVRVEAGIPCPLVAKLCAKWGLTGVEFLAGIPGTVGGALEMNAGAFGGEMWAWVTKVEMIDRKGKIITRFPKEFTIGYREVVRNPDEWYVAAHLKLAKGNPEHSMGEIRKLLRRRRETQPIGLRSAGSVFQNPPHHSAAQLIEASGLKGIRVGGAAVSEKHANFIINEGQAKASDIACLMNKIQEEVNRRYGIYLVPEVRRVGNAELM
ncbi:MAG: UDP-N-acetylmuramate dehydrogenase [Gammaproteobacteria bacterium]|nr:UDP-N-acetylmuramate dehydrogenase [Gammaproteobacteria bacterium]